MGWLQQQLKVLDERISGTDHLLNYFLAKATNVQLEELLGVLLEESTS